MKDYSIETNLLVRNRPIREYHHEGLTWVEAREGSSYAVRIRNNTHRRKLIVVSVDGINVITGEPATREPEDGYVIAPYSSTTIEGWRISDSKVKEFIFTFNKKKSYAVKLGHGQVNLGVIGILAYDEKDISVSFSSYSVDSIPKEVRRRGSGDFSPPSYEVTCSAGESARGIGEMNCFHSHVDFQAGTGKGKEVHSVVESVTFRPGDLVSEHIFYYDSWKNLKERGVVPYSGQTLPKPFAKKYCPDI